MTERVMDISMVPSYLFKVLRAKRVRVREMERTVTILPVCETDQETRFSCPFLGIAADSSLTVDRFFEWKREERVAEAIR